MLYDVFICHASEDKRSFVRPLAEALRRENVAVWYDDFTMKLGDSIRRALDRGLKQSRFGVVVLSKAFFKKRWPQHELDALVEREMRGSDKIILPVWHGVTHDDIIQYSPPLADRRAVSSADGLAAVVDEILDVVHPQLSPIIVARDTLLEWGVTPPVITDQYWLDVVEASNRIPGFGAAIPEESTWNRWSFPLPDKEGGPQKWGEKLAWTAMQMKWVKTAEEVPITPLTPPDEVLQFITSHPGLLETCKDFPHLLAEHAPQLTIPGFGGPLEKTIEEEYRKSCEKQDAERIRGSRFGSGLTTDAATPACDEEWILRHPSFGNYSPSHVAHEYFAGGIFGPSVSPYEEADHAIWLLSSASSWLPDRVHVVLLQGMKDWITWLWHHIRVENPGDLWPTCGKLSQAIHKAIDSRGKFRWTVPARADARSRIAMSVRQLGLPETADELYDRFVSHRFPECYIQVDRGIKKRRSASARRPEKQTKKKANKGIKTDK